MKGYLFIFISALSLGITPILYKKCSSSIGPINTTFFYYLFGTIIAFIAWLLNKDKPEITLSSILPVVLLAVFMFISILTFTIGINFTKVSVASTIRAFSFLFTLLIALIFFNEVLTLKQIVGILLAGVSIFLITT